MAQIVVFQGKKQRTMNNVDAVVVNDGTGVWTAFKESDVEEGK